MFGTPVIQTLCSAICVVRRNETGQTCSTMSESRRVNHIGSWFYRCRGRWLALILLAVVGVLEFPNHRLCG